MIIKKHIFTTCFTIGDGVALRKPVTFTAGLWIIAAVHIEDNAEIYYVLERPNRLGVTKAYERDIYSVSKEMLYGRGSDSIILDELDRQEEENHKNALDSAMGNHGQG